MAAHFVVLAEYIDISNALQLQAGLIEHLNAFGPELVLDLSPVKFIDSTGLGAPSLSGPVWASATRRGGGSGAPEDRY